MKQRIKVLVVDDSALMRKYLREMLEHEFEVYTARDGEDALRQIREIDPDVVTLDINMPVMDGITCLTHIMSEFPRPVIMVSSLTEKGALVTFEALELGAVDYIPKPGGTVSLNIKQIKDELIKKIKAVVSRKSILKVRNRLKREKIRVRHADKLPRKKIRTISGFKGIVLIGSSTGGPSTLEEILSNLPGDFPLPILVAQHMPESFTRVFAKRLNKVCELEVVHVEKAIPLEPGKIYIAKGNADVEVKTRLKRVIAESVDEDPKYLWHPSVDKMVESALNTIPADKIIAVLLTGMGYDGAKTMAEVHRQGGKTIAESEETAVVFGMPRELIERNGADFVLPSYEIADKLAKLVNMRS
ncbi:chemotaxis-specific protein-glutamate methyltransferase CheB [Desulfothermus okinawensis JCM 13304]